MAKNSPNIPPVAGAEQATSVLRETLQSSTTLGADGLSPQSPLTDAATAAQPIGTDAAALGRTTIETPVTAATTSSDPVVTSRPAEQRVSVEEVRASTDSLGVTRSAEVVATTLPAEGSYERRNRLGSLPVGAREMPGKAKRRVLASGVVIPAHIPNEDRGEERVFTAATRIMKSKTVYEIGAPVPLTRAEFLEKVASVSIREREFEAGDLAAEFESVH